MEASARTQSGLSQTQGGPYQSQVGQASQYSHAASPHSDGNGNQVTQRPSSPSLLYDLLTANITKPESGNFIPQNGALWSGQTPNWQTARAPQQTVSSLQVPAGGRSNNYHQGTFTQDNAAMQASCVKVQSGNNEPQQALHQNSLNRPDPSPPNGIQHNPLYLLQGVVSKALIQQWHMLRLDLMDQEEEGVVSNSNQQVPIQGKQPVVAQDVSVNCVPPNRLQCGDAENASYQNVNRIPVNTLPAPATSVQHRHMSPARTSMSTTTYSQQMTHNNSNGYGIDGFQRGVLPHTTAPSQSQSLQSISHVMTSDSSSGQSLTQITEMATSSSHSATHPSGSQYSDGRNFPKINGPHTGTLSNSQMIPGDANNVNLRQAAGSTRFLTVVNNAVNSGTRLATSPNASPPYFPVQKDISSNQHSSGAPPEGRPVQKGYYVIVSEDESVKGFKVDDIVFHEHKADTNGISKGLQRCSLNEVLQQEQCHLSSGKTSLQRHGQQSLPQTPASSSKVKDSNHIYPGHAGQKAIAIVKPLSQTNNKDVYSDMCSGQCKQTTTTDESGRVCEETSIVKPFVDHIAESTSLTQRHKYVNGNVSLEMSTEEGADAMTNHDTGQSETLPNYLHAEDVESQPSGRMQATPTSHQPVTTEVPSSRSEAMGETKRRDEPIVEFDLSSVPLIQWKYDNLTKLIEILDKRINSKILSFLSQNEITIPGVASTILSMFWEATYENVWMEVDSHTSLINEIEEFCSKHVASDSVILSYSQELIKNCYILTHDAVHCENTYKSSWLNTNEQLDDIHKEFDFPWSLKYGLTSLERDEQPTLIETENGFPENAASEVQNEGVSPIEITTLCDDDYVEKQASSARDGLNQTPVPLENATADSIDSSYSFKIDVLPPEEARTLFEKLDSEQVNTENTEDHSEMIMNVEDDLPEMATVRLGEVKLKNKVQAPIQEFCCTMRLMEVMGGSNTPSLCNCQPRREQSADGVTVKRCEEERDVQTENVMNLDPSMESKNKVDIGNAMDNQTLTPTWMTECENLLDITEEDEILHSQTNMEPKRILPSRTPSVDSNIIVQEIDDFFSCNETELSILNSELEMCYGQSEQKRPESTETQFNTEQQTLTFQNDVSLDSQLTSTEKRNQVTFLSSLSLAQNNFCIPHPKNNLSLKAETLDLLPFLKKIKVSLDPNSLPAPEDNLTPVDQPLNGNGNIDDLEPVHSKAVTVKLALFGSSPQKEHGTVINSQRSSNRHSMSCRNNFYLIGTPQPPTTVSVTVGYKQKEPTELTPIGGSRVMKSPDKQGISEEPSETGPKSDSPVEQPMLEGPSETGPVIHSTIKQRIYEEWRNCFVPTKRKSRGRVKSLKHFIQTKRKSRGRVMTLKKHSFASSHRVRPETTKAPSPTVTEELPVASEGQSPPGTDKTKQPLSAPSRETFFNLIRQRHGAVHCENTYKSSWLNTNEQRDDIHKEFDFPLSLKYGLTTLERDEQPTLIETENGFPENTASEVQNEGVSPTEITALCDDDYVEKQASSTRDGLNQTPVPLENATADSIDSSYSFKIDVLPPEEARTLFEKLNSEQMNTEKTEDHSEMIMNVEDDLPEIVSVRLGAVKLNSEQVNTEKMEDHSEIIMNVEDALPEMVSVRLGEVNLENKVQAPIQEFCCTMRWMEVMGVSNTPSLCNCQSRREQSADGVTAKSCEEERDVQTKSVMKLMKLDPTMESKNKVDIGNAINNQTLTPTWIKQCENFIDLTEENEILLSQTNMEPKRILPSSTPLVDSNIIVREIDDFFSCSETELSILNDLGPELEMYYGQSEQKWPESTETQFNTQQQTLTFQKEVSLDLQLTSTEKTNQVTFLSSPSLAQNNFCIPHRKNNLSLEARRKHKRRAETPDSLPFLKNIKVSLDPNSLPAPEDELTPVDQPLNGNGNIDDLEPVHSKAVTIKLALFGSLPPKEHGTVINSQRSSNNQFVQRKRKSRGRVMTLKKHSFSSSHQVRPETTKARPPTVTEELPVASEGQSPPGTDETKHAWGAQRESLLKSLRQRVEKSKTCGVTPKKPADTERSKYDLGNPALMPLQGNNVLRFNVLPKTFNFNHGPGDPEESTDPQLDIPDPDKEHGRDSKRPAKRLKGAWAPDPPKKYNPLPSLDSQVPKTSTIFQQFQKKYKKKK